MEVGLLVVNDIITLSYCNMAVDPIRAVFPMGYRFVFDFIHFKRSYHGRRERGQGSMPGF